MMKMFTLFMFLIPASSGFAQYAYTPGKTINITHTVTDANELIDLPIYFHNQSANPVAVIWRLLEDSLTAGWEIALCDNVNCYYNTNNALYAAKTSEAVAPGDSMFLKASFSVNCIEGEGWFRISAKPDDGSFDSPDTLSYYVSALAHCASSISHADEKRIQLHPNPVSDHITISGWNSSGGKIQLLDVRGRLIETVLPQNHTVLPVSSLMQGFYFLQFMDVQDRVLSTRRFLKL